MPRFLATHALAPTAAESTWRDELTRLATAAHEMGIRPVETFYSMERMRAYTLYDATDVESIREVHSRARLTRPDEVLQVDQIFTELLAQPRRERYA